jgi:transposase
MMMPPDDLMSMSEIRPVARVEVFTGSGRRREWSFEQKAAIVAESYGPNSVSDVARRNGLMPAQLFTWRRAASIHDKRRLRFARLRSGSR